MANPGDGRFSVIKKVSVYSIFVIELLFLFKTAFDFVESKKYFMLSKDFAIPFVLILLFTLWTVSLISHTIEKKWEIFISPSIILLLSFIFLNQFRTREALIVSALVSLYYLYQLKRTRSLTESFLKINVRHSNRPVTKGFLFIISVIISIAVFLMSENMPSLNVGKWAADLAGKPIEEAVKKEFEKEVPEDISSISLKSLQESNPQVFAVLNSFGINEIPASIPTSEDISESVTGTIKKSISDQVNKVVEPYRKLFNPAVALLVFGLLQIFNSLTYFLYSNSVSLVFLFLRKTKLVNLDKIPTEKEILKF